MEDHSIHDTFFYDSMHIPAFILYFIVTQQIQQSNLPLSEHGSAVIYS
jgi:hypothetical protein